MKNARTHMAVGKSLLMLSMLFVANVCVAQGEAWTSLFDGWSSQFEGDVNVEDGEMPESQSGAAPATSSSDSPAFTIVSKLLHDEALAGAHDVELSGDFAFVPGKGGSNAVVDVADPEKPRLLWFKRDTVGTPDSETVLPVGKHLLLGTKDFLTLDIRDPTNPVILKKISDRPRIDQINGIIMFGDYAIAANKSGYINAFDVTDMEKPTLLGVVETRKQFGLRQPHDVDRFGDYIVLLYINGMVS